MLMKILFAAGHVGGAKIWMGYNEDENMLDLARREARYAAERYGQDTAVFKVTNTSYQAVEDACRGCDLAIFEHSNADDSIDEPNEPNRVVIYRTVKKPGDGICFKLAQVVAPILNTAAYPVLHRANSAGDDWYGVLKRAMIAGCSDTWLAENGFHTHGATRAKLSDPTIRQQIAEAKVDVMAQEYGWTKPEVDEMKKGDTGEAVKLWQTDLLAAGYKMTGTDGTEYGADGNFGGATERATIAFQIASGLPGSGVVGDLTWAAMVRAISGKLATALADEAARAAHLVKQVNEQTGIIDNLKAENLTAKAAQIAAEKAAADMAETIAPMLADLRGTAAAFDLMQRIKDKYIFG